MFKSLVFNNKWRTFINPSITKKEDSFMHQESCMSFPNKSNKIIRYKKIELTHQVKARNDSRGDMWKTELFYNFDACIIQHEIDHLNGIHIFNKNE